MNVYDQLLEALSEEKSLLMAESQLKRVLNDLKSERKKLSTAEKTYKDELVDLEKMEKLSLKSVFYKVLGSEEKQIEKERQEYLDASLKFNEVKSSLELLDFEKKVLDKKLAALPAVKERVKELKSQRERQLLKEGGSKAKDLRSIIIKQEELVVYHRELMEAQDETDKLLSQFGGLIAELKRARNWGRWDMGSKQSRYYTRMKYQSIDRAKNIVYHIKQQANILRKELSDIGVDQDIADFEIYSGNGFMDMFLDNIITDWIVQKKISDSLKLSQSEYHKVVSIANYIKKEYSAINNERSILVDQRDRILSE